MSKVGINEVVYDFVLNNLSEAFEKSDSEFVFSYIIENYTLADSCKNSDSISLVRADELKVKIEKIRSLAIGKVAPEIRMKEKNGKSLNLSDIKAKCTLVLFWASWCKHCTSLMPYVYEIYEQFKTIGLQVVAISVDKDRAEWEKAIATGKYTWINYCEVKGWESQAAIDYYVWKTPRMYLLDKEKNIVAKPVTIGELKADIMPLVFLD